MIRRYQRRGPLALARRALRGLLHRGAAPRPDAIPTVPLRALPEKIQIIEEYRYDNLHIERNGLYPAAPHSMKGEIQIDLPFDRIGHEAMADGAHQTARQPGAIEGRVGWLGLDGLIRTDIAERFGTVRPWAEPGFSAFPLCLPLVDEATPRLERRIEGGWHEREFLDYTPHAPKPYPFRFHIFLSRDSAVPVRPRPPATEPSRRLDAPSAATGKELAIHMQFVFSLRRPPGVTEEGCTVKLDFLTLGWPYGVGEGLFRLKDLPDSAYRIDSRLNNLFVTNLAAELTSTGQGPLRGTLGFTIVATEPAVLEGVKRLSGMFKLGLYGVTLSEMRAQFFDAAGYPRSENAEGQPLVEYRTDIFGNYDFDLGEALREAPALIERLYSWNGSDSSPNPFRQIQPALEERNFAIDPALGFEERNRMRWWATRQTDGQPLIVDLLLEKRRLPRSLMDPLTGDPLPAEPLTDPHSHGYYELNLRIYYRGRWEEATQQLEWLEESLRQRLLLRHPATG